MRVPVTHRLPTGAASLRLGTILVVLIFAVAAVAAPPGGHRPLPPQVSSQAPGIHPFGKGRHSWWGIQMYDATLWIVGPQWSAAEPHALDLEPNRAVSADTLVKNAIAEMRALGNEEGFSQRSARRSGRYLLLGHQPDDCLL